MSMHRDIVWEWADRPGLEHLSLDIGPDAIRARGLVLVQLDGVLVRLGYDVSLDGGWAFERARLTVDRDGASRTLEVERSPAGAWRVDGRERPDLAGCVDIDIMTTPFTNSLPIRRLTFAPERPERIWAAYIAIPELAVTAAEQEYTRLDPAAPPGRFRYRSRASGFTADLTVDHDGLVVDYPGPWRRRCG
jgi:hypothetical protein